jgi:hypothetical protein
MAQSFYIGEQVERCRRLARDSADPVLRGTLLVLADDYATRAGDVENGSANASEHDDTTAWQAGSVDTDTD